MKKTSEICYFVETLIDDFSLSKKKSRASFFKYLQLENVDRKTIGEFLSTGISTIKIQIQEIDEALFGEDLILKEAYSRFRKPELRDFKQMLTDIIDDAVKYKEFKRVVRKPKLRTPSKIVEGLNILETSVIIDGKEYVPIPKTDIIGSKYIVFYNVKSQEVTIFIGKNLSCKGSKIINYDETISGSKKLKVIHESLDELINSNQFTIETNFSSIANKFKSPPKIISVNSILIKAIR